MYDPLNDIRQYNTTLTIAQVMKFCEKKGLALTRPMVQNYIRLGVLPPPVNKRFYTHGHLAAMVIVEKLKTVFEIEEIKEVLKPFIKEDGLPLETYELLMKKREAVMNVWIKKVNPVVAEGEGSKNELENFAKLTHMAHTADLKTKI